MNPKEHYGRTYRLTGPELVTGVEIAGKASKGLNRAVRYYSMVIVGFVIGILQRMPTRLYGMGNAR